MSSSSTIKEVDIILEGLGFILYSPINIPSIESGENFLSSRYRVADQVEPFVQAGSLVGFETGTPGKFLLRFVLGEIDAAIYSESDMRLTLGLVVVGGYFYVRDLYDLIYWEPDCWDEQRVDVDDGMYTLMVCSRTPISGVLGDNQIITVFMRRTDQLPDLSNVGIPSLVGDD